ncbi:MAG: hypothetical protein IIC91_13645 [Chloroflexi bacterium]|nr:hypothetical protein [Chloroflexota bacterium]
MQQTVAQRWRRNTLILALVALVGLSVAGASRISPATAAGGVLSITAPDTTGDVGQYTSLVLDAAGNPVVSYYDATNNNLKLLHCNDPDCSGGESITAPDTAGNVGSFTSLELDASGNPVISYFDGTNLALKLLHCNDPNCAGGDESITTADVVAGQYTSLVLDVSGNPVVSYYDATNDALRLLHCNDPNCAGGDESITTPDTDGVGTYTSLVLDASGNPVVSYHFATGGDLRVLHCNDPNCAGDDESITAPDDREGLDTGEHSALVLDSSGNPVVSYFDATKGHLTLLHCNDPNCAGAGESITAPDTTGDSRFGPHTSLALDASGNPVVSYFDGTNLSLMLLHCDDPNCEGGNESNTTPDSNVLVGSFASLALDAGGNPVVSYYDATNGDLKLLHCNDPNCAKAAPTATPCPGSKVPLGAGGCGTPTPTPTPGLAPEMLLNIKGGNCDDSERPTACDVPVGEEFLLSVDAVAVPSSGYILAQTFVDFGKNLTFKPSEFAIQEISWPDCQSATVVRSQIDHTLPAQGLLINTDDVVGHSCITGLIPPLPASHYVGNLVEFVLTCSTEPSTNPVELLPYDPAFPRPPGTVAGTNGALFTEPNGSQIVPLLSDLTVNCVDVAPVAVGGVALGGELRGIATQDRDAPWLLAALGLGAIAALGALAIARRRHVTAR